MSYFLLATSAIHALFILYSAFKNKTADSRTIQLISGGLLIGAIVGVFILPRYSGYIVGLGWLIFLVFPQYCEVERQIAIRKQEWEKAAVWARRAGRVMPLISLRDLAVMYDAMGHLSLDEMAAAAAVLESYQPQTPSLREWFRWQAAIMRRDYALVRKETGRSGTELDEPTALSIHHLVIALENDLAAYLDSLREKAEVIGQQSPPTQARNYVYLFALIGRPDLVQQARDKHQEKATWDNWLLWLGAAQYNAGDIETAEQTFQAAAQSGDDLYRQFVDQYRQSLQSGPRPTPTAEQQAQIDALISQLP